MEWDIERTETPKKNTDTAIKELSIKLIAAEKEISRLKVENDRIQADYNKKVNQNYHDSYQIANQLKIIEDLKKTMELYEKENKAMRALLQCWI